MESILVRQKFEERKMMTANNSPDLISGHTNNKIFGEEMAKTKLINCWDWPYDVKGKTVNPGEQFEEEGLPVKELVGNGKALVATPENIKAVEEKVAAAKKTTEKKNNK